MATLTRAAVRCAGGAVGRAGRATRGLLPRAATPAGFRSLPQALTDKQINGQRRLELAAAYWALDKYGMSEGTCNHLTALAPAADGSDRQLLLLVPAGTHWSQVTPSCLLGLDDENQVVEGDGQPEMTAMIIHRGVRSKQRHLAVMHTHAPYVTALGCLEDPRLLMTHQNALRFYGDIAYDKDFPGPGNTEEEGERLAQALGDKRVMMMCGHGVLTTAPSIALAFDMAYYMERCAMFQMIAMATGKPLCHIAESVAKECQGYYKEEEGVYAKRHLEGMIRLLATDSAHFQGYQYENLKHTWTSS